MPVKPCSSVPLWELGAREDVEVVRLISSATTQMYCSSPYGILYVLCMCVCFSGLTFGLCVYCMYVGLCVQCVCVCV